MHEDDDILGRFTPEEYTPYKPGMAFFLVGCVVASVLAFASLTSYTYPDAPAVPRTFGEDGLESELGGPGAVRVGIVDSCYVHVVLTLEQALKEGESWEKLKQLSKPDYAAVREST